MRVYAGIADLTGVLGADTRDLVADAEIHAAADPVFAEQFEIVARMQFLGGVRFRVRAYAAKRRGSVPRWPAEDVLREVERRVAGGMRVEL